MAYDNGRHSSSSDLILHGSNSIDASQALDELRLDVLRTQKAVEEIRAALGRSRSIDYAPSLAAIVKGIAQINTELKEIEGHPALRYSPADYQRWVHESGRIAMEKAIDQLEAARNAGYRTEQVLISMVGKVRDRWQQARWLAIAAGIALISGLILSPLLARLLPFRLDTRIAAVVLASDRWNAGIHLMQVGNPDSWAAIERAGDLLQLNRDAIQACELTAGKNRSAQHCTVLVPPP